LSDRNDRNIKRYNDRNDTFCLISENHSLFDSVMFNKLLEIKMICFSSNDLRHKNSNFL
jgi:phage pi2 protein 07